MLAIYATAILIVAASLVAGTALLRLLGRERPTCLSGAVGFAALTVAAPILLRLPGRATTATIVLFLLLAAGAAYVWGRRRSRPERAGESRGRRRESRPASLRSRIARLVRGRDAERSPEATPATPPRTGRSPGRLAAMGIAAIVVIGIAALSAGQVSHFFDKLGSVQGSPGRLSS